VKSNAVPVSTGPAFAPSAERSSATCAISWSRIRRERREHRVARGGRQRAMAGADRRERPRLRVVGRAEARAAGRDRLVELGLEVLEQQGELQHRGHLRRGRLPVDLARERGQGHRHRAGGERHVHQGAALGAARDRLAARDEGVAVVGRMAARSGLSASVEVSTVVLFIG
jgi:hypothetical protein